jgi:hypothetical protein
MILQSDQWTEGDFKGFIITYFLLKLPLIVSAITCRLPK